MVNEVLFGELFEILEEEPKWIKIKLQHDGYQGWIDPQMCTRIPLETSKKLSLLRNILWEMMPVESV